MTSEHREFYLNPLYYDIAFDVRDTRRECDFLAWCVKQHAQRDLRSAVELGSGPGYHALELARRGLQSYAVDIEQSMVDYLLKKAGPLPLHVQRADMRDYSLPAPVDLAYILFGSFCYLLTNQDILANLRATHRALAPGGLYLLEQPHPRKYLRKDSVTQDDWVMERDGVRVHTRWDIDHAVPDPLTQIMEVRSEYEVTERGRKRKIRSRGRQRVLFAQELMALAAHDGLFEAVTWYGAMDRRVRYDYSKHAWRMVAVLRKMERTE